MSTTLAMTSPSRNFGRLVGGAALRRMRSRLVPSGSTMPAEAVLAFLKLHRAAILQCLGSGLSRAFLALEIVFQEDLVLRKIGDSVADELKGLCQEQLQSLRASVTAAGLSPESDNREVARWLQRMRKSRALSKSDLDGEMDRPISGSPEDVESRELEAYLDEADARDESQGARMLLTGGPATGSLVVGLVDYFFCRALQADTAAGGDFVFVHFETPEELWPADLQFFARVLETQAEKIEALLDRVPESSSSGTSFAESEDDAFDASFQKGFDAYMAADYERSIVHFSAALKLDAENFPLLSYRGDAYRLLCIYDRAIADYSAALRLNPTSAAVLVQRAKAYRSKEEPARALEDATAAVLLEPTNAGAYLCRADAHMGLGELDAAIADYSRTTRLQPDLFWAFFGRGEAFARKGKHDAAIADFSQVLELNPNYARALFHRGEARAGKGDLTLAIHDFTEFLRHHPRNQLAYRCRAQVHQRRGEIERAMVDFTAAIQLDPKDHIALLGRGILLRRSGDGKRALEDLNEAIRLSPESAVAYFNRGLVNLVRNSFSDSLTDFNAALKHDPNLTAGYLGRALVQDRLGQFLDGVQNCGRALQLGDHPVAAHLLRGILCSHAGRFDKAIFDLSKAIDLDPALALSFQERGMAYMLSGDTERATADFSRLIELTPGQALAHVIRGTLRQMRGNESGALEDFGEALRLDPQSILNGWHQPLAESTRTQGIQSLIDTIEGIRPQAPKKTTVGRATQVRSEPKPETTPASADLKEPKRTSLAKPKTVPSSPPVPRRKGRAAATTTTHPVLPAAETAVQPTLPSEVEKAPKKGPASVVKTQPAMPTLALEDQADADSGAADATTDDDRLTSTDADEIVEITTEDVEILPTIPDASEDEAAGLMAEIDSSVVDLEPETVDPKPAPPPTSQPPLRCPSCRQDAAPYERLPDKRIRCGRCQAAFVPSGNANPTSVGAAPPSGVPGMPAGTTRPKPAKSSNPDEDDDSGSTITRKQKYVLSGCGAFLLAFLVYFFFPSLGASGDGPPIGARLSADLLLKEFIVNRTAAASKYTTSPIVVSGEVEEIIKDKRPRIRFKAPDTKSGAVEACFSHVDDMKDIEKNKTISVRGECEGWRVRVVEITLCKVVPAEAASE